MLKNEQRWLKTARINKLKHPIVQPYIQMKLYAFSFECPNQNILIKSTFIDRNAQSALNKHRRQAACYYLTLW